jgi:hypothetical protein
MRIFILALTFSLSGLMAQAESETAKGAKKDYQQFKAEMNAKLDDLDRKIDELKTQSSNQAEDAKNNTVTELEADRAKLKNQLDEMESSGKSNWRKFKGKLASSFDTLNAKVQRALKH